VPDTFVQQSTDASQVWYTVDDAGSCVVVAVGGRIDSQNCPGVCDAVRVAGGFSSGLVIDVSRAEFTEAAAIGLFVAALKRSHRGAGSACVVGAPEPVRWLIRFGGLATEVATKSTVAEAVTTVSRSAHGWLSP
jgi:anti-anti-sigma factor